MPACSAAAGMRSCRRSASSGLSAQICPISAGCPCIRRTLSGQQNRPGADRTESSGSSRWEKGEKISVPQKKRKRYFLYPGCKKQQYLMGGLRTIQGAMRLAVGYCRRTGYHPRFRSRFHGITSPKQNKTLALFILSSEENRCFMA